MTARRDILFLIEPDFAASDPGLWYCPDCALVEGVLAYYPRLREQLDVRMVQFARPRPAMVALLGEAWQELPALLVDPAKAPAGTPIVNGYGVINTLRALLDYLAREHGAGGSRYGSIFPRP